MKTSIFAVYILLLEYVYPELVDEKTPTFSYSEVTDDYLSSRYLVKFKKGSAMMGNIANAASPNNLFTRTSSGVKLSLPKEEIAVMDLDSINEVEYWETRDDVEAVELDTKVYLQAEQIPYGIKSVKALTLTDSDVSNRKVCIIDTGFDINHPDLTSDLNVVSGYTGSLTAGDWKEDGHGHGTHVAGTIAAIHNSDGVLGVNRNGELKLHIVKVFDKNGSWTWGSHLMSAVQECVDAGANVVNMSLGGSGYSSFAEGFFSSILENDNVLLVAAAGNHGNDMYSYPASFSSIMSVAAININNDIANFSQHNDEVDIAAPGVGVLSTLPLRVSSSGYGVYHGTSMSAPHVSGVAALVWSLYPEKTALEIRTVLEESAEDLGTLGRDNYYGHGLVRADLAAAMLDSGFTFSPTITPPACFDYPEGWHDSDGIKYDCNWYATSNNCEDFGDGWPHLGKTAQEACCACGGGNKSASTSSPTKSPTVSTKAPTFSTKGPTISTKSPSIPTSSPTSFPTPYPSNKPTNGPSEKPTIHPTESPSVFPSALPSAPPTKSPTKAPTKAPTNSPTSATNGACQEELLGRFFFKLKSVTFVPISKNCRWLDAQGPSKKNRICAMTQSRNGFEPANKVCLATCKTCDGSNQETPSPTPAPSKGTPTCDETPSRKFVLRVNASGNNVFKSCRWLSTSKSSKIERICGETVPSNTASSVTAIAREVCRSTCKTCPS